MARALQNVELYIWTDKDGAPSKALVAYEVADGAAKKKANVELSAPAFTKITHNIGATGEFWKDAMDAVKAAEGI